MNTLFLDIVSHKGLIACLSEEKIISSQKVSTRVRDHELIPIVEECLKKADWAYSDLTNIACVIGPGGFTSLRIAVSFANTLIDQLDIDGVGIHLSDLYKYRISNSIFNSNIVQSPKKLKIKNQDFLWLHATKKNSLFIRGFGKYEKLWLETRLISLNDFEAKILEEDCNIPIKWMGELLDEQKEYLKSLNLKETELIPISDILPKFVLELKYTKKQLEPWYGRE